MILKAQAEAKAVENLKVGRVFVDLSLSLSVSQYVGLCVCEAVCVFASSSFIPYRNLHTPLAMTVCLAVSSALLRLLM